jgi:hypothetical protein
MARSLADTFRAMVARAGFRLCHTGWLAALAATAIGAPAAASPRDDPTTGRAVFTGATLPGAPSIILNPAALGLGSIDEVYVAMTSTIDQLHMDLAPFNQGGLSAAGARVRDVELSPGGELAFIYHLAGDRGTLGFDAKTNPRESFAEGHGAASYHTLGGGERDVLATLGASIKVTSEIYFGASLSHQNTLFRLKYNRDSALASSDPTRGIGGNCGAGGPCTLEDPRATESYDVDVRSPILSTSNLEVNIGVVVQLAHDIWLGVAYHTPPGLGVQTELSGHVDVTRAPRDVGPGDPAILHGESVVEIQFPASVDSELRARLPGDLELHVAGRWEDLSRLSSYDVRAFGSTLPRNGIPEWTERPLGMHDSFSFWGGVEQVDTGQRWLLGGRLGVQTSAVDTDRTSPLTIEPTSFSIDLGAQWRISRVLVAQLSYGLSYFPTVTSKGSEFNPTAQSVCAGAGYDYNFSSCEAVRDGYGIPPADGTYERFQHAIRLGLRYVLE